MACSIKLVRGAFWSGRISSKDHISRIAYLDNASAQVRYLDLNLTAICSNFASSQ